jgi:hypothetical protein
MPGFRLAYPRTVSDPGVRIAGARVTEVEDENVVVEKFPGE